MLYKITSEIQETCYVDTQGSVWTDHDVLQNSATLPMQVAHSDYTFLLDDPNPRTPRARSCLLVPVSDSHIPTFHLASSPLDIYVRQEYVHPSPAKLPPWAMLETV